MESGGYEEGVFEGAMRERERAKGLGGPGC